MGLYHLQEKKNSGPMQYLVTRRKRNARGDTYLWDGWTWPRFWTKTHNLRRYNVWKRVVTFGERVVVVISDGVCCLECPVRWSHVKCGVHFERKKMFLRWNEVAMWHAMGLHTRTLFLAPTKLDTCKSNDVIMFLSLFLCRKHVFVL